MLRHFRLRCRVTLDAMPLVFCFTRACCRYASCLMLLMIATTPFYATFIRCVCHDTHFAADDAATYAVYAALI